MLCVNNVSVAKACAIALKRRRRGVCFVKFSTMYMYDVSVLLCIMYHVFV